jgi:hypothetical protein
MSAIEIARRDPSFSQLRAEAALDDSARSGKAPTITPEAKAWLVALACQKAKDLGYPHELWTTRLLASHAREHGPSLASSRPGEARASAGGSKR